MKDYLSYIQRVVLAFLQEHTTPLKRSEIAKILIGSQSIRTADFRESDYFGRLAKFKRKTILQDVDILVEQGFLRVDRDKVVSFTKKEES